MFSRIIPSSFNGATALLRTTTGLASAATLSISLSLYSVFASLSKVDGVLPYNISVVNALCECFKLLMSAGLLLIQIALAYLIQSKGPLILQKAKDLDSSSTRRSSSEHSELHLSNAATGTSRTSSVSPLSDTDIELSDEHQQQQEQILQMEQADELAELAAEASAASSPLPIWRRTAMGNLTVKEALTHSLWLALPCLFWVVGSFIGVFSLQFVSPTSYSLLQNLRLIFAAFLSRIIMKRTLTFQQYVALVIVLISCIIAQLSNMQNPLPKINSSAKAFDEEGDVVPEVSASEITSVLIGTGLIILQALLITLGGVVSEFLMKKRSARLPTFANYTIIHVWTLVGHTTMALGTGIAWPLISSAIWASSDSIPLPEKLNLFKNINIFAIGVIFAGAFSGMASLATLQLGSSISQQFAVSFAAVITAVLDYAVVIYYGHRVMPNWIFALAVISMLCGVLVYVKSAPATPSAPQKPAQAPPVAPITEKAADEPGTQGQSNV